MMFVADPQQSILLDTPREVDIAGIERELIQLWKHASGEAAAEGSPVVRACSLNFVVVAGGSERTSGLEEIISQVTVDHPSRIMTVSVDWKSGTPGIDAWVSARCSLPVPGGKQVCCEEINLSAKGTDANKVPSIVTSLLVPDIPTIVLWKARLDANDKILQMLTHVADRVLIDSSEELHPAASLASWGAFMDEHRSLTAFGDLAWTHLTQWRNLVAQTFQPAEVRQRIAGIDTVTIEYSSTNTPRHSGLSQSFLTAAWLAHALRWVLVHPLKEQKDGDYRAMFRLDEQAITVHMAPAAPGRERPGGIESIVLHFARGGEIGHYMTEQEGCIRRKSSLAGLVTDDSVVSLHQKTEAGLVSDELEVLYHDPLYESSMLFLTRLLASGGR